MEQRNINVRKAVVFIILSSLFFAIMQVCVKLSGKNIPLFEQVFFRNLITLFLASSIITYKKQSYFGKKEHQKYLFARAFFGYTGVCGFFYATNHMSIADASILQKSSPIFIAIFTAIMTHKKMPRVKSFCIALAFFGTMLVVRPKFDSEAIPSFVALLSAILTAFSHMALTRVNKYEQPFTIVFYFSMFSTFCSLPFMLMNFVTPSLNEWLLLLGIGVFAGLGQIFLTFGYRNAPASRVSIYTFTTVIFATTFNAIIFNQFITILSLVGIALIFASSYYDYMLQKK